MHKSSFSFSITRKFLFYASIIYYLALIPLEVKKGKINILLAEVIWLFNRVFRYNFKVPQNLFLKYYETIFGKFYITPDLLSTIAVSPKFERLDVNYLLALLKEYTRKKNKILFLDIGAYFGLYSVLVGKKFKIYKKLDIIAFEPGTEYLSAPTISILKKNIKTNNLRNILVKPIGIGSKREVNKLGIKTDSLDSILGIKYFNKYDVLFIKMDIDDFVVDGIKGIIKSVNSSKLTILFIEDFVKRKETIKLLESSGFIFICKLTEYNSFWLKK